MFVDLWANALSLSMTEKSTWNDTHTLLINYFNNSIPSDSKEIYQFEVSGKVSKEDSVSQVGKSQKGKSKKSRGPIKGQGFFSESESESDQRKGEVKGTIKWKQNQRGKVNGPHGQAVSPGPGVKVKVAKEKVKINKYVLAVVVKVIQ